MPGMDENPYNAPAGGFASAKARNWRPFALGIAIGCAIAAAVAISGTIAIGVAVSNQVEGEWRFRENAKAREAAERADEKDRAATQE